MVCGGGKIRRSSSPSSGKYSNEPQADADLRIVREDHHRSASDAAELAQAALSFFVPVVEGQDGHRRVDGGVAQGERAGGSADRGGELAGALGSMTSLGSIAITWRSRGSYEPVPAPTLTIVRAAPSAP
jgi:hypothetical protein